MDLPHDRAIARSRQNNPQHGRAVVLGAGLGEIGGPDPPFPLEVPRRLDLDYHCELVARTVQQHHRIGAQLYRPGAAAGIADEHLR
jgi:hypothetical protein